MLAIDIGNSRIKWAVFADDEIQRSGVFDYDVVHLESAINNASLPVEAQTETQTIAVSCVANADIENRVKQCLREKTNTPLQFAKTQSTQCGVSNSYAAPDNMGVDRWLAMIAAFNLYKIKKDEMLCVIDCGTAITFDVLNAQGVHAGGLIMPGYQTMVQSLLKETGNIQQAAGAGVAELYAAMQSGLASSTKQAVSKGCAQLVAGGLSSLLNQQQKASALKLRCIITGGDGQWLSDALNYENTYHSFLVLQGLNFIATSENL